MSLIFNFIKSLFHKEESCKDPELKALYWERAGTMAKNRKLRPCFHCGRLFTSSKKWAINAGPHLCHHGYDCGIWKPECPECPIERHKLHEMFR